MEVNRKTGHVWVKRLVCAHDCGLVINPESAAPHGRVRHAARASRALHEEVRFDTEKVTSVDWIIASDAHAMPTCRRRIDVVLVNGDPNPGPTCRTTAPARRCASR